MERAKLRGFTFVEIMLAVTIFAVVAIAISSTFATGLFTWRKAQQTQNLYQEVHLALNKMAEDLQNAVLYTEGTEAINFLGTQGGLSFFSLVDVFQVLPPHPELRKITYSLDEETHTLQRLELTLAESMQDELPQQAEELAAGVSSLNLFYCYTDEEAQPPYKWQDNWSAADKIPEGLKIELQLEEDKELIFSKYVFIPVGEKGQQ